MIVHSQSSTDVPLYNFLEVTHVLELLVCWHCISTEHPGLLQTAFPINFSSPSPWEGQTFLSNRSLPEFILNLSLTSEGWRTAVGMGEMGCWGMDGWVGGLRRAVYLLMKLWWPTAPPRPQQLRL